MYALIMSHYLIFRFSLVNLPSFSYYFGIKIILKEGF